MRNEGRRGIGSVPLAKRCKNSNRQPVQNGVGAGLSTSICISEQPNVGFKDAVATSFGELFPGSRLCLKSGFVSKS